MWCTVGHNIFEESSPVFRGRAKKVNTPHTAVCTAVYIIYPGINPFASRRQGAHRQQCQTTAVGRYMPTGVAVGSGWGTHDVTQTNAQHTNNFTFTFTAVGSPPPICSVACENKLPENLSHIFLSGCRCRRFLGGYIYTCVIHICYDAYMYVHAPWPVLFCLPRGSRQVCTTVSVPPPLVSLESQE